MKAIRKFKKCAWCGATIDKTNSDRELCDLCAKYPNMKEAFKHREKDRLQKMFDSHFNPRNPLELIKKAREENSKGD